MHQDAFEPHPNVPTLWAKQPYCWMAMLVSRLKAPRLLCPAKCFIESETFMQQKNVGPTLVINAPTLVVKPIHILYRLAGALI